MVVIVPPNTVLLNFMFVCRNYLRDLIKMQIQAVALLGVYPKNIGILIQRDTCTPMFTQHYLQ